MTAILALLPLQTSFVAKEAGLAWSFAGKAIWRSGHYDLVGKELRGEVYCFTAPNGHFDSEALYQSDVKRTKDDVSTTKFNQYKLTTDFTGIPAILSEQQYLWVGASVASRCVYAAQGKKAWVVRLWWPDHTYSVGVATAEAFLKSCRRTPEPSTRLPNG
jgi:hypothetical protein